MSTFWWIKLIKTQFFDDSKLLDLYLLTNQTWARMDYAASTQCISSVVYADKKLIAIGTVDYVCRGLSRRYNKIGLHGLRSMRHSAAKNATKHNANICFHDHIKHTICDTFCDGRTYLGLRRPVFSPWISAFFAATAHQSIAECVVRFDQR